MVHVEDRGHVIPKRIARIIVYIGPMIIFNLYNQSHGKIFEFMSDSLFNDQDYLNSSQEEMLLWEPGNVEKIATNMIYIHFTRRIIETLLMERLAHQTTSLRELFWQSFLYWCLLGMFVGYSIFHTEYMGWLLMADEDNAQLLTLFSYIAFGIGQVMSCLSHYHYHQKVEEAILEIEIQDEEDDGP